MRCSGPWQSRFAFSLFFPPSWRSLAAGPSAARAVGDCSPAPGWPGSDVGSAARVVELVNEHRSQLGLAPLGVSGSLASSADWKARHMAHYGYMQHSDPAPPVARSVGQRLEACGYTSGGVGREHRLRLSHSGGRGGRLARLARPSRQHREPRLHSDRRRCRGSFRRHHVLGPELRHPWRVECPPPPSPLLAGAASLTLPDACSLALAARAARGPAPPRRLHRDPRLPPTRPPRSRLHPRLSRPSCVPARSRSARVACKPAALPSLAADDSDRLAVRSRSRRIAWIATFAPVPNSIGMLRLTYRASSSRPCAQTVALWSFAARSWVALDTRSVGKKVREIGLTLASAAPEYVSRTSGDGEVRVRVSCARAGRGAFSTYADLLRLAYA